MASVDGASAASLASLASQPTTPIAQLNPDLPDQASRVVRGQVTITWPFNSVTRTAAFLLAEPDVRLRRARGQVRVEFRGPSAKAVSECGLGAGDELLFSLEGVEWAEDVSPGRIPGSRVDWQLQFNARLVLQVRIAGLKCHLSGVVELTASQVRFGESGEVKHIDIDCPTPEQPAESVSEIRNAATPEPEPVVPDAQSVARKIAEIPASEYPSPAFVKRARLSYGALFEGGFDIFEEDGGVKGKGRKRTKFGRDSSAWRYSSQSPTPEPASPLQDGMEEDAPEDEDATPRPSPKARVDEGCQTVEAEMVDVPPQAPEAAVPPETPVSASRGAPAESPAHPSPPREEQGPAEQAEDAPAVSAQTKGPSPVVEEERAPSSEEKFGLTSQKVSPEPPQNQLVEERPVQEQPSTGKATQEEPQADLPQPEQGPAKKTQPFPSALFGTPKRLDPSFSMFGAGAPVRAESSLSLADQVRFGFSHIPQTAQSPAAASNEPRPTPGSVEHGAYPESYLDNTPTPAKYADMTTTLNAADEQVEMAAQGQGLAPEPPMVESFGQGQWEIAGQSQHYNPVEGGHFGADALGEGDRIAAGQPSLHEDVTSPGEVPEGFASYGRGDASDERQSGRLSEGSPEAHGVAENEEVTSEENVGVDEEDDKDAEYDEYAYGERLEEGDYDQRNYDRPDDDDEGLSEEYDEAELEARERYGDGDVFDAEGEEWDEEGEDLDESEEDESDGSYHMAGYQPGKPAARSPPKEPIVIDLLSDSEDDDKPATAPAPGKHAAAPQPASEHDQSKPSTDSKEAPSSGSRESPAAPDAAQMDAANIEASEKHSPERHSAPSEGSSEGLFVSQQRSKASGGEAEEIERAESDSEPSHGSKETDNEESADSDGEEEFGDQEQSEVEDEDEQMSVVEIEEDQHHSSPGPESHDSDDSLPDAEDASFVSQVEMGQEAPEDEDESMNEVDSSEAKDSGGTVESQEQVEEDEGSAGDVDMLEAPSPHREAASPAGSHSQSSGQGTNEAATESSEDVSKAVVTTDAPEEALPSPQSTAQKEERAPISTGPVQETSGDVSSDKIGGPAVVPLTPTQSQSTNNTKSQSVDHQAGSDATNHEMMSPVAQGVTKDTGSQPAEPQHDVDAGVVTESGTVKGEVAHGTRDFHSLGMDGVNEAQDERIPDSSLPSRLSPVAGIDGPSSENQSAALSSQAGQGDQPAEGVEGSARQTDEPEMARQQSSAATKGVDGEAAEEQSTQEQQRSSEADAAEAQPRTRSPSPDLSVNLARQALAARRPKKGHEPVRTSRRMTRARSSSLQTNTSLEREEDSSVSLAIAALASPSKRGAEPEEGSSGSSSSTAALKLELARRLRTDLPECIPLKSLRLHVDKTPHAVVAVATTRSSTPRRAKNGPREYFMSFHVTDPSAAPAQVVEVQLYRPHAHALPVVAPGHPVLLLRFHVRALRGKGFGLRSGAESAWAVWDDERFAYSSSSSSTSSSSSSRRRRRGEDGEDGGEGGGDGEEKEKEIDKQQEEEEQRPPQIRGPPVEDYVRYAGYAGALGRWFASLDGAARAKLERADRKLLEAGGGGGGGDGGN